MDGIVEIAGSHVDWANKTNLHPLALATLIVLGGAMLVMHRRHASLPMILMACFIAPAQRIVILGLDFDMLRIMVLFGWMRVISRGEWRNVVWKPLDMAMGLWVASGWLAYVALRSSFDAAVFKCGEAFDALGMYCLFRCLVREFVDVERVVGCFTLISVPVLIAFAVEHATGHNACSVFGGVPAVTMMREGRLRCQGAFSHPIIAGCFWASLMPLIAAQWWLGPRRRLWAVVGVSTSSLIVFFCASSTPLVAVLGGGVGALLFYFRYRMRLIRWTALAVVLALHFAMKAPVWHLVSRIDMVGGSTGWHRFYLIDQAINHFSEWCLTGTLTTGHWGLGLQDVTNQYVFEGVRGGIAALALFVAIIALGFRAVGRIWRAGGQDNGKVAMGWALGVSLFIHCLNYAAVSYFGQIIVVWYLQLAALASLSAANIKTLGGGETKRLLQARACVL